MNTLVKTGPGTAIAPVNPYRRYAAEAPSAIGTMLKYKKGEWRAGQAGTLIPIDTKFVALLDKMLTGYIKWENKKPKDQRMALATVGVVRADLGEMDQTVWPLDKFGKPQDPWQKTTNLPLLGRDGKLYVYSTSSVGGLGATRKLSDAYAEYWDEDPVTAESSYPIIKLGTDSYNHDEFDKVQIPTLDIVGVFEKAKLKAKPAVDATDQGEFLTHESENPADGMEDDEIPF